MNIGKRLASPTPPFFRKVRNIGLMLTAISAAILGLPVALHEVVVQIAEYMAVAGGVMTGVSQAAVQNDKGG